MFSYLEVAENFASCFRIFGLGDRQFIHWLFAFSSVLLFSFGLTRANREEYAIFGTLLLHETIFRRSLFSSFDSFSIVPFSGQTILVVFGGSLQASASAKEKERVRKCNQHNQMLLQYGYIHKSALEAT